MSFFQRVKNGVRRAVERGMGIARLFSAHRITTIAGALAFFLVLSVVPLFFWLTLLFGREGLPEEPAFELFAWAEELISYLVKHAGEAASGAGVVLLLTTLWSASSFFYHLRRSGELLSGTSRPQGGLRTRLLALLFTLAVVVLLGGIVGLFILLGSLIRPLPQPFCGMLKAFLLFGGSFLAAMLLNFYAAPKKAAKKRGKESLLVAVLWLGASAVFLVYARFGNKEQLYGALSLLIVFFLYLYWMMICLAAGLVLGKNGGLTNRKKGSKIDGNEHMEDCMTKVNDLPYSRVTLEETQAAFETFFAAAEKAKCAEDMLAARQELITRRKKFDTAYCLANIRFTQNTADPFYKGEMDYYDEVSPLVHNELAKYFRVMLESPFRKELEAKLGSVLFAGFKCAVKAHSEEIVEDEQQENALTTEYSQLMAGMLFDWQGEKIPLTVLRGKLEDPDPAVRKAAADASTRSTISLCTSATGWRKRWVTRIMWSSATTAWAGRAIRGRWWKPSEPT